MTNTLWRGVRGHGTVTRLMAATLAIVFMVAVAGPGLALDGADSEPTSTPEPVLQEPMPADGETSGATGAPGTPIEGLIETSAEESPDPGSTASAGTIAASSFMTPLAVGDDVLPPGPFSRSFSQLANETGAIQWINGDLNRNNSTYKEGMSVPQRLILTGITTPDTGHYVTFGYDYTKSGKYAHDFITSWSQAAQSASNIAGQTWSDSWQWIGVDPAVKAALDNYYVDVTIPSNGVSAARETAYESVLGYGVRTVRVYSDQPLTNVYVTASTTPSGSTASDSSLTFTVYWDGPADGVMILYASHIANSVDPYLPPSGIGWGAGMGASGISGSPYHNYTVASSEFGGGMDNSMKASSVDAMSGITGMKFNDLDGDGVYPPETGELGLGGWQIWADLNDDGDYDVGIDAITTTAADGRYGLYFFLLDQSKASSIDLYEVQQPENAYVQTYPASGYHTVSIAPSQQVTGKDFGNYLDLKPLVKITKTASPTSVPETGAPVTFTFVLENTGPIDWTLTSLNDTVFGNLKDEAEAAWLAEGKTLPVKVAVGGSWRFTYITTLSADDLVAHHNVAAAVVSDADGDTDSDSDDADVTFTDVPPSIRVTKTADPTHVPEGGDYVTFTVTVENTGSEDVTLTSLSDSVFGDLDGRGTIALPQTIPIGGSYSGSFTVALSSDTLTPHHDVVTATAVDDDGTQATDDDDATVTFDDTAPEIAVTKTASPASVPETGGDVTFTVTVENTGEESVTLTGAVDTVFGPIPLASFDTTTLGVGQTASASFTRWLASDSLTPHHDVVTVTAEDNDGTEDSDSDDADVTFTDVAPVVSVVKTADPEWMIMPGGTFHYTATVTNDSAEAVQIISVVDDVFGTIYEWDAEDAEIWLGPNESRDFDFSVLHDEPGVYPNTVTVVVEDNDGTRDSDEDSAEVVVTDPKIEITKTSDAPAQGVQVGTPLLVTYTYLVRNTGDVPLYNILVTDDKLGEIGTLEVLGVGESKTFTKSTTITDGVTNIAEVTAIDEHQNEVSDTDDETIEGFLPFTEVDLAITKAADKDAADPGELVTYTLTYWNTGDKPATNFTIVDDFDQRYMTIENAAGGVVADGKITWTIPGPLVSADGKKSITYTARIASTMPDGATNVDNVVVVTVPDDADGSNDRATERVVVSEPFLPFTGGDYLLLLVATLAAAGTGVALRMRVVRTERGL